MSSAAFQWAGDAGEAWLRQAFADPESLGFEILRERGAKEVSVCIIHREGEFLGSDLAVGGVDPTGEFDESLVSILQFVAASRGDVVLFEHALGRRGDPFLGNWPVQPIFRNNVPYLMVDRRNATRQNISRAIDLCSTAGAFRAYIVARNSIIIKGEDLNVLAQGGRSLICDVFDGESYAWGEVEAAL